MDRAQGCDSLAGTLLLGYTVLHASWVASSEWGYTTGRASVLLLSPCKPDEGGHEPTHSHPWTFKEYLRRP